MRIASAITLDEEERNLLNRLARSRSGSVRLAERSRIVLLAAQGKTNEAIAEELAISRQKAGRWRSRYSEHGLAGIERDAPRPGRNPQIAEQTIEEVITLTTQYQPEDATHWSRRLMAGAIGISESSVGRIWKAHGLKPHLVKTFKLSNDKQFVEKLEDVVGLYLSPPRECRCFQL